MYSRFFIKHRIKKHKPYGREENIGADSFVSEPGSAVKPIGEKIALTNKAIEVKSINLAGQIEKIKISPKTQPPETERYSGLLYTNVGYYLVVPIITFTLLGYLFDKWLNTKPVFIIISIFLGAGASFYNILKLIQKPNARH